MRTSCYVLGVISIRIHFHGAIDRRGLTQDHVVSCPRNTTVEALLHQLGYPPIQLKAIVPMMVGQRVRMIQVLTDGDALDLLAPAGGG